MVSQVTRPSDLEPPVRWWTPPSDSICEPYSPVVTWPTASPCGAHRRRLRAEMAVGVDLHLDAAVAEDAFGDDGDQVDALDLLADDEGRRLVVGIGGAGADAGDEAPAVDELAVPLFGSLGKGHRRAAVARPHARGCQRVEPDDAAVALP